MKNILIRKRLAAFLLCLSVLLTFSSCGSKSSDHYGAASGSFSAQAETAPAATPNPSMNTTNVTNSGMGNSGADGNMTAASPIDRKLVKNANVVLETKEFDNAIPELIKMAEAAGGYIERQSQDGKSMRGSGDYYERTATIMARIPADKLTGLTSEMETLCNIISKSEAVDDITDRYFDADAHLRMLQTQEKRLLELLEKAETLENIIQLEQALSNCQYEIESLTGQIRRMDSQVAYSTLNITVNEVVEYNVPQSKPRNFTERLGDAFVRSGRNILSVAEGILFFLIIDGPVLAIYILFVCTIIYIVLRIVRYRRAKRSSKSLSTSLQSEEKSRQDDGDHQ